MSDISNIKVSITPELESRLNSLAFDEKARRSYDIFAGGLVWSDESTFELTVDENIRLLLRVLTATRSEFILGKRDPETDESWLGLKTRFPNWPGFRPERCSQTLRESLRKAEGSLQAELDYLDRVGARAERIAAIRAARLNKAVE